LFSYDFYSLYRVWVLRRRKLKNSLRFSFLLLVTHWFAGLNVQYLPIATCISYYESSSPKF
jgi:hypothetical protein